MVRAFMIVGVALLSSSALAGEDCTCSHKGAKIPEGQKACIKTSNGMQMAQCSRVLNNTSWKFLGTPCPTAQINNDQKQTDFNLDTAKLYLKKSG
jgi:hypothetical protein